MKIRFIGPLGTVTGSCTWLEHEGTEFLVDCGLEQEDRPTGGWNTAPWPFDPARLRFVVLTHAHADHCGLIPALYRRGFAGVVYCTKETANIARLMLKDSARLSNGLYTDVDVEAVRWKEPGPPVLGKYHPVDHDLFIQFFRTAHVIGAVSVRILWGDRSADQQKSIVFSGDLGPDVEDHESLPFLRHRMAVPASDFAVIESTYGSRTREPSKQGLEARKSSLKALVDRVMETQGSLLIPAFSLGRVQDLLFDLHFLIAEDRDSYAPLVLRLDAPLARDLAPVLASGLERTEFNGKGKVRPVWLGKQIFRWLGLDDTDPDDSDRAVDICRITLGLLPKYPDSAMRGNKVARAWPQLLAAPSNSGNPSPSEAQAKRPQVIVATSGMGDHGRSAHWLRHLLRDPLAIVAFSGYCAASSIGGKLQALAGLPASEKRRLRGVVSWPDGHSVPEREISAVITALQGYSGHADQAGLLGWMFGHFKGEVNAAGRTVFIQHGNEHERVALARAIELQGQEHGLEVCCVRPAASDQPYRLGNEAITT